MVAKGICEQPTQFEVLTAAAFMYFALENVDYAVIEVGMGDFGIQLMLSFR